MNELLRVVLIAGLCFYLAALFVAMFIVFLFGAALVSRKATKQ